MIKLYYNSRGGRFPLHFSSPDDGGGSRGQSSNDAEKEGEIKTPFDNLPWEELSDEDRPKFEQAKKDFVATLQQKSKLEIELDREKKLASGFQSEADRLKAVIDKSTKTTPDDPILTACYETLIATGYPEKEARALAAPFADMHRKVGVIQKQEIGKDLMPMAQGVLANQATDAFQAAAQQDVLGVFKQPEVAQKVWEHVSAMVGKNQPVDVETVANLGKMAWSDFLVEQLRAGKTVELPAPGTLSKTPPNMNTGGPQLTYPGASLTPIVRETTNSNGAKTELNADTRAALAKSFSSMTSDMPNLMPSSLKTVTPNRRNR